MDLRGDAGNKSGSFSLTFIFSAIIHAVFFAALIVTPGNGEMAGNGGLSGDPVITVSMVTLQGQPAGEPDSGEQESKLSAPEPPAAPEKPEESARESEETAEEEIPEPEVLIPPTPEPKKTVVIPEKKTEPEKPNVIKKPEPEKPKPVKKPEPEKPKVVKKPDLEKLKPVKNIKEPEKKAATDKKSDEQVPNKLAEAIDRLKQKHKNGSRGNGGTSNQFGNGAGNENGPGQGQGRGSGSGFGGWGGRLNLAAIEFYKSNIIPDRINRNWSLSEHLLERRFGLKAILVIKIMPDGRIEDAQFEQQSGDRYFDDSVLRAVMKSNPLPAPPREGYVGGFYQVGLIFTPEGLN